MVSQFIAGMASPPGCDLYFIAVPAPSNHQHPELITFVILVPILPTKRRFAALRRTTEVESIPIESKIKQYGTSP